MAVNHVDIFAARDDADMAGGRCEGVVEGLFLPFRLFCVDWSG